MSPLRPGFNLLELMIVLAIIAFLSMIILPNYSRFLAKAKRAEAYTQLRALYLAEKAYYLENDAYTPHLSGKDSLGWTTPGPLYYTYGFSGSEKRNHVIGTLKAPATALKDAKADKEHFKAAAAGDIDGDGEMDILTIDQDGHISIENDDLN